MELTSMRHSTPSIQRTAEEFWKEIEANPKDWDIRLIFADWLEEVSEHSVDKALVLAMRWMGRRKKCAPFRAVRHRKDMEKWAHSFRLAPEAYRMLKRWWSVPVFSSDQEAAYFRGQKPASLPDKLWKAYDARLNGLKEDLLIKDRTRRYHELALGLALMDLKRAREQAGASLTATRRGACNPSDGKEAIGNVRSQDAGR
jgi:uncharacterized protein (TIGR02996 family)